MISPSDFAFSSFSFLTGSDIIYFFYTLINKYTKYTITAPMASIIAKLKIRKIVSNIINFISLSSFLATIIAI